MIKKERYSRPDVAVLFETRNDLVKMNDRIWIERDGEKTSITTRYGRYGEP